MTADKEKAQRRVYVLPNELVERIVAYQTEMAIQSEVEAARRLLDEALKRRDDWRSITRRFLEKLKYTKVLSDIAGEVLVGHPLIENIRFAPDSLTYRLFSGEEVTIGKDGKMQAVMTSEYGSNNHKLELDPKQKDDYGQRGSSRALDDDIPF